MCVVSFQHVIHGQYGMHNFTGAWNVSTGNIHILQSDFSMSTGDVNIIQSFFLLANDDLIFRQ